MATGGDPLLPSKEKTNFLRLVALVIDGGTLALRTQFDAKFPPLNLGRDLKSHGNLQILYSLKNKRFLTQAQIILLFPPPPKITDSNDFDVSLLSCLIQNLPAFHQQNSPVWRQVGPPVPTDFTLAADVKRLRYLRNFISHQTSATLTDQDFQARWQEASDAIQRLCTISGLPGIPGLQNYLANTLQLSIDPEKEQEYIDKLNQWEDIDCRLEKQEMSVADLQDRSSEQEEAVSYCRSNVEVLKKDITKVKKEVKTCQEDIDSTSKLTNFLSGEMEKEKKRTDGLLADQEAQRKMSSELRALVSRSKLFFLEKERHEFIETASYSKALEILNNNKVVILSGHPGEGKTTMGKQLLLNRFPAERCINLREPGDWKHLDLSLNVFDAILIDDIFGSGVLEENLVKKWERKLTDLATVIKEKVINVVITSRHYILEETKQLFRILPLFKKENILLLTSKDLTDDEKFKILKAHLTAEERQIQEDEVFLCIMSHASVLENLFFETKEFLFGFPECVNLFARQDDLFARGPEFFSRPYNFVRNCIHQLYRDEKKFLALIVLWANDGQCLKKSELDESKLSDRVAWIAKQFKFKLKRKLLKRLRRSLNYHIDGLLHFSKETGIYTFSHSVICDMVGLVIAKENPDEVLEFCTRAFLLTYVTTQPTDDEFKFYVDVYLFKELAGRLITFMIEEVSIEALLDCGVGIFMWNLGGKVKSTSVIDSNVLKHDSFLNKKFADLFLDVLSEKGYLVNLLEQEIMEMSVFFLRYGLKIEQQKYFLLSFAVFIGADAFAESIISQNLLQQTALSEHEKAMENTMALFFAVHHQNLTLAKALVERGAYITEEVLYIASHKTNMNILKLLLEKQERKKLQNIEIVNGNNGLIVASKKGFVDAVKCFIEYGYNLTARNNDGLSAIDKAVAYKHEYICELLVKAGAPFNNATRKFKRTPLHTAVDLGLTAATKCFLQNDAKVKTKDHKGLYPIHSAALNRHLNIVRMLLAHDPEQARFQTKTYGSKSMLKGKTVFHIALYKQDYELLSVLLQTKANPNVTDWYGRTVFFESVLLGNLKFINMLKDVADMSISDKNGFTPLHVAVYNGYPAVVKTICSHPLVNVNARDKYGKTPLHVAASKGFQNIFCLLVFLYNADWRMITNRGDTVIHIVSQRKADLNVETEYVNNSTDRETIPGNDEAETQQLESGNNQANDPDIIYNRTAGSAEPLTKENEGESGKGNAVANADTKEPETKSELGNRMNMDEADKRTRLKHMLVRHPGTCFPDLSNIHENTTPLESDIWHPEQGDRDILTEKKATLQDYNVILTIIYILDKDFFEKRLKNKRGTQIIFDKVKI